MNKVLIPVEVNLPHVLNSNELSSILTHGIKFFLHERSQITVPYERLHSTTSLIDSFPSQNTKLIDENRVKNFNSANTKSVLNYQKEMKSRLREIRREQRAIKKAQKVMRLEASAKNSLELIFERLDSVINALFHSDDVFETTGLVLSFGSTFMNPKELIIFNFEKGACQASSNESSKGDWDRTIKKFYKTIIMSQQFPEFTSRKLGRTYTHLTILTSQLIPASLAQSTQLRLVENNFLSKFLPTDIPLEVISKYQQLKKKSTNTFYIRINSSNILEADEYENIKNSSCYQIPLIFRGIS